MNKDLDKVINIVSKATKIGKDELNYESKASSFAKWDSIAQIELIMELEKKFNLEISPDSFEKLNSISSICQYLEQN